MFGIYALFRGQSVPEINSGERFIDDTDFVNQNSMIERMLSAGLVPPVSAEAFDEEVNKDDFEIPKDAEVRSYDADLNNLESYASELFNTPPSGDGEDERGVESTESQQPESVDSGNAG